MALVTRPSFARGWMPDADAVKAPPDALLRMDNCLLDELGAVTLRLGCDVVYTLADVDVHSLYTAVLGGTRYRFAGAGDALYANGSSVATSLAGTGSDLQFGSMLGQVFAARSTAKKKYDGTTLRNWGLSMTGGTPTVTALAGTSLTFISGNSTESPACTYFQDDGTGAAFTSGFDGTANGAIRLHFDTTAGRGEIRKTFASDQDFSTGFDDDSIISLWVWIEDGPLMNANTGFVDVSIWTNNSLLFVNDYYFQGFNLGNTGTVFVTGWNKLIVRRGDMFHGNATGTSWDTVRAVSVAAGCVTNPGAFEVRFDALVVDVGPLATTPLSSGNITWKYRYAYNSGTYVALSAPSAATAASSLSVSGATVTVPADTSRDSQTNEIWLYRNSPSLGDDYYRVTVKTGVSGTGSVAINDTLSDADAVSVNLVLDDTDTVPPNNIVSIAAPHFDRLWVLTSTTLYPSRILNPDTFSTDQAITIGGADETGYWVVKAAGTLYVGTSRDIYRIEGTAAELPDGTLDVQKVPMNVAHPPLNAAVAAEGSQSTGLLVGPSVAYFSTEGWRAFNGYASPLIVGPTSLLYKGYTRHGVSPVNTGSGRIRACLGKDQLLAITPEGTDSSSSAVVYRGTLIEPHWYRHTYPNALRSIASEPDGTIIAGDTAGHLWTLDSNQSGTDDGAGIPVVLWTKADDGDDPFRSKVPTDLHVQCQTGGTSMTAAIHQDQSATAGVSVSVSTSVFDHTVKNLLSLTAAQQVQLRLIGTVSSFKLGAIGWTLKRVPIGVLAWDSGPIDAGPQDVLWVRAVRVHVLGSDPITVTVYGDGLKKDSRVVTPTSAIQATPVIAWLGRGVKGGSIRVTLESDSTFVPYWIELIPRGSGSPSERKPVRLHAEVAA